MASFCAPCLGSSGEPTVWDVIIVGGGISATYAAYQLKKKNKKLTVCICEKSDRLGGRLLSDDNDQDNLKNKDELGGMRIFPSIHGKVAELIKETGCSLTEMGLADASNLFYSNGESTIKSELILDPEMNRTPNQLIDLVLTEYKKEFEDKDPLEVEEIRSLNLRELMMKYGATEMEFERFVAYSGYDLFSDEEVSAAIYLKDQGLYGSKLDEDQHYVKEGYDRVPVRLAKKSKATVKLGCNVAGVTKEGDVHKVETSQGDFFCDVVMYALPLPALEELVKSEPGSIPAARVNLFSNVKNIPLFKAFLEWERHGTEKQWWEAMNFLEGKSTTDEEPRQIHYYDHEDILIYNSGAYAESLFAKFVKDSDAATLEIYEFLKKMHNNQDIPKPDVDSTVYKFWPDGSHKWKKNVDILPTMEEILIGSEDEEENKSVYICGDAFSVNQGWVMGCVETVDLCLQAMEKRGMLVHTDD